tara:strand:+ start:982 stop:1548 length:567 start_codon:yes stop_codon:yes gene_type:complete
MVANPQPQEFTFIGFVTQIDNTKNYRPFRFGLRDENNQTQWFGTFDKPTSMMIEQGGVNSGAWNVVYVMKPWTGSDGVERYNYNVKSLSGVTGQQAPTPQPMAQPQPTPQPTPQPINLTPSVPTWVTSMDDRGRSIIRQVAFKDVLNKDDKSLEEIARLTDAYEAILLCMFEPESPSDVDDSFIQQDF